MNTIAQDFSKHKWENRLVIIYSNNIDNYLFTNQLFELKKNEDDFLERKLLVYQILPDKYKVGFNGENNWEMIENIENLNVPFEIKLIGLDGSIKLSQKVFLTSEKLFAIIDKMPMRRIEIENKKKLKN